MSSKKQKGKSNLKQGNLFSFFSKKPKTQPAAKDGTNDAPSAKKALVEASKQSPPSSSSAVSPSPKSKQRNENWKKITIGARISVYWPDDDKFYDCTVTKQKKDKSNFYLEYDDDTCEWIDLKQERFRFLKKTKPSDDAEAKPPEAKRRRIASDDEEEAEFEFEETDNDDEGSVYDPKSAGHDKDEDDEDVQWMVTDDEDDREVVKRADKTKKKTIKVTHEKASSPGVSTKKTSLSEFANTVSPQSAASSTSANLTTPKDIKSKELKRKNSDGFQSVSTTSSAEPRKALPYTKGAVNPRGSHLHNHLNFLRNPRDIYGRKQGDPDYDPRTLKVVAADWEARNGKMTDAVKQWWELKSQYFDTILMFKTGKFYELFHMDADVGVDVLGLTYMKGHVAHAGFPEIGYGSFSGRLVRAGYKVARVEQTETPEMLKERKKKNRGGKTPKVVNREVCSIVSLGTRTYCYLDDGKGLSQEADVSGGNGPLLAIREVMNSEEQDMTSSQDDDTVRPICEYGVTIIDAVRATVTIGQFADDVLRSRMNTLLTTFAPSEILLQGGDNGASPSLKSLIRSLQNSSRTLSRTEVIQDSESFPKSTALDTEVRRKLERPRTEVHPWDVDETLEELHRRGYYPRASRKQQADKLSVTRWPKILRAAVEGEAHLAVSSFGAALFYLQRHLVDSEILSMGIIRAYIPPASSAAMEHEAGQMDKMMTEQTQQESEMNAEAPSDGHHDIPPEATSNQVSQPSMEFDMMDISNDEDRIGNMSLDGTTLHNLEILTNSVDHKVAGSLWSKINYTKTPHGARMLRAWLLRPLFRKNDIERRSDAVEELVSGAGAVALTEAQAVLSKIGDLERLLSRVHSMSGMNLPGSQDDQNQSFHPNDRAILYEGATYTKRKVGDFSKLLSGLRQACRIPELFADIELKSGLLGKIVKVGDDGGCFPVMSEQLDWYFENFDCDKAAKGLFEPSRGVDEAYDCACDTIERIKRELADYKNDMCNELTPRHTAKSSWKYINIKPDSKDKYLVELPASVRVPDDFILKGKRGSGAKQVNKYRTSFVAKLVHELESALEIQKVRKARGMQLIFSKFDSERPLWAAAAQATAMLDALGSLAKTASKSGFTRAKILDCPPDGKPSLKIVQGRHPCVETTINSSDFIPNDLHLGGGSDKDSSRVLLLSGPNMGGKSTLLRQTCLIAVLAQIGSYVPAEECELTPIDCIYTRLGASDRILLGQSTFFVELAETAAALRGATRRSLVIMDELGRGTSTFDGTAIAGAAVKHLVDSNKCVSLFATHYHSLLDEWKDEPNVRLGHMQCLVESETEGTSQSDADSSITFLYTLGDGTCPKSFGINVARLASLPAEVLAKAKRVSAEFEEEMNSAQNDSNLITRESGAPCKSDIVEAIERGDWDGLQKIWNSFQKR